MFFEILPRDPFRTDDQLIVRLWILVQHQGESTRTAIDIPVPPDMLRFRTVRDAVLLSVQLMKEEA